MTKSARTAITAIALAMLGPGVANADAIQDWNVIALGTASTQNPLAQTRFVTITHLAMFEAVNAITRRYEPYLGTVDAPRRPVTAIQAADTDGNPWTRRDATWMPLITTPCHPSYPSAHASGSNAGRRIAERLFGSEHKVHVVLTHPAVPDVTLTYTRLWQITADIDDARVYGGIHFRTDQDAGAFQGRRVADEVYWTQLRRRTRSFGSSIQ